jgi:hypothetical protein
MHTESLRRWEGSEPGAVAGGVYRELEGSSHLPRGNPRDGDASKWLKHFVARLFCGQHTNPHFCLDVPEWFSGAFTFLDDLA